MLQMKMINILRKGENAISQYKELKFQNAVYNVNVSEKFRWSSRNMISKNSKWRASAAVLQ